MKSIIKILLIAMLGFAISCDKGDEITLNPNENDLGSGIVKEFNNNTGGTITATDGTKIIVPAGSIGLKTDGSGGDVSFSIEKDVKLTDLPVLIPSKYKLIGSVVKFSPASFIFSSPLFVYLPASSLSSLEGVSVIRLNEKTGAWVTIPICDVDATKKLLGVSTFELGYFAVVQEIGAASKIPILSEQRRSGGLYMEHSMSNESYFTILVVGFTPKYPEDASSGMVGTSGSTGGRLAADGPAFTTRLGGIPQGTYVLEISKMRRGTFSTLPGPTEYYSTFITAEVGGFSNTLSWDWTNWSGWTLINLTGGTWVVGTPPQWPAPDKPFGTGQFQTTLTWVNNSGSGTDIDLHLFGPNNEHVYWRTDHNTDGSIVLDRDWQTESGYATENIFSTKTMPKGTYKVYVNPYSGTVPKNFEVRIILRGSDVKTFRGTAQSTSANDSSPDGMIYLYSFTI